MLKKNGMEYVRNDDSMKRSFGCSASDCGIIFIMKK